MKKASIFLSVVLLLVANTIGAEIKSFHRPLYPPPIPLPELPTSYVDKLVVNTSDLERTVAENKCESHGIQEIFELIKSERFEELWVFIPGNCRWIEIGRHVTSGPDEATIKVDRKFLAKVMVKYDELHLYHFHPLAYFETCRDKTNCDELSLPVTAGQISQEGLILNLRYSMPSAEDIYFMMDVSWEFDQRRRGNGKIVNKVVTPYGILDYALTDAGKNKFFEERNLRTAGLYIKLTAANALLDSHIDSIIKQNPNDIREALEQLVQSLNSKYLRVSYTPL
ncbi:MAG: hypothetical protein ACE5NW_10115 [Acidiferrobacterales bacterium]